MAAAAGGYGADPACHVDIRETLIALRGLQKFEHTLSLPCSSPPVSFGPERVRCFLGAPCPSKLEHVVAREGGPQHTGMLSHHGISPMFIRACWQFCAIRVLQTIYHRPGPAAQPLRLGGTTCVICTVGRPAAALLQRPQEGGERFPADLSRLAISAMGRE